MTIFAFFTKPAPVKIIGLVTGHTFFFELCMDIVTMAGRTTDLLMAAFERKLGILVMIKPDLFPIPLGVTFVTFFAIGTTVHIVDTMTVITYL